MQHFNLDTMSGVFPGMRTQIFQRIRLGRRGGASPGTVWAQLLWAEDGTTCDLHIQGEGQQWSAAPLSHFSGSPATLLPTLHTRLAELGWQVEACGSCDFWHPLAITTMDGLPAGRCTWTPSVQDTGSLPASLSTQCSLALACPHWQPAQANIEKPTEPIPHDVVQPMRKVAEISESKLHLWTRWRNRLARLLRPSRHNRDETIIERSGVGAGTESCLVCQGRIANLGALAVETPDGDRQTFSIWRCRNCYTTYLNDWIDRWERLDSLDTEEAYYRIAPHESLELLTFINNVAGGEHPGRRSERSTERSHLLQFLAGRIPLSHQVRQGR